MFERLSECRFGARVRGGVSAVSFDSGGSVVTNFWNGARHVFNVDFGRAVGEFRGSNADVAFPLAVDGVAVGWADERLGVLRRVLATFASGVIVTAFVSSPDRRFFVTATADRLLTLWDAGSGDLVAETETAHIVHSVKFTADDLILFSQTADAFSVWDLVRWEAKLVIRAGGRLGAHAVHAGENRVAAVVFSRTPSLLAQHTIRVWNTVSGDEVGGFDSFVQRVNALSFTGDGGSLASGHADGRVIVWDASSGGVSVSLGFDGVVNALAFGGGSLLAAVGRRFDRDDGFLLSLWGRNRVC